MAEIQLELKAGDSVTVAERVAAAMDRVARRVSDVGRAAPALDVLSTAEDEAEAKAKDLAARLKAINQAAQVTGGPLAGLTAKLAPLAESISAVGIKATVANVGLAALASGGLAVVGVAAKVAAAGIALAVAGTIALGANALSVASDIETFDAQLGHSSDAMVRNRTSILELRAAQNDLAIVVAETRVELAGLVSGPLQELVYAAAGVVSILDEVVASMGGVLSITRSVVDGFTGAFPILALFEAHVYAIGAAFGFLADRGRATSAALHQTYRVVTEDMGREADALDDLRSKLPFNMEADAKYRASVAQTATATRSAAAGHAQRAAAAREEAAAVAAAAQPPPPQLDSVTVKSTVKIDAEDRAKYDALQEQAAADTAARVAEQSAAMRQTVVANIQGIATAAIQLGGLISDALGASFENSANRSIAARRKQFKAMKAAAIAEAAINTALAFTNALTSNPYPLNIVYAALTAAAGGVQIGLIASKQFHRGGLLPDEQRTGGIVTRSNERTAVITGHGMQALGGEQGLNRLNAGQATAQPVIQLVIGGRTQTTRRFAGADPGYGQRGR